MRFTREEHANLRGGEGCIVTYTAVLKRWLVFGRPSPKKRAIKLVLEGYASVGKHRHTKDSEIYFTFNRKIRFNGKKHWSPINICLRGNSHSAENIGERDANIYAFKF